MTKTLISVDLDWLNGARCPIGKLKELLQYIPREIPVVMTIEHHQFLPHLRRWIKSGKIQTPFNIINLDEHHDYYINCPPFHPGGTKTNCGNWGYRLPQKWYSRFTWVQNSSPTSVDWTAAQQWLKERNIASSARNRHGLSRLKSKIVAATFCVSPNYMEENILNHSVNIVEIVASHFKMKKVPTLINNSIGNLRTAYFPERWHMAPRQSKE